MKPAALVLAAALSLAPSGCSVAKHPVTKQAILVTAELALAACVAEHQWMEEHKLLDACRVTDDLMPVFRELLRSQRKGMAVTAQRRAMGLQTFTTAAPGTLSCGED